MSTDLKKKVCLIGAFAVGKTSLVRRYVDSLFSERYLSTVGVKIDKKQLVVRGRAMGLIIWDLHGEDGFQSVRMSYLRGASGCIYVADGTRRATLDTALMLRQRVEAAIGPIPAVLVLNKCDLEELWEVDPQTIPAYGRKDFSVLQTSAKTGQSVEIAFETLAAIMLEDHS